MLVLVTGGAGFIGSHLVEALIAQGKHVRVFDNFSSGRLENLSGVKDKIELIHGDISDLAAVTAAAVGCALIFHQAALVSVPRSIQEPVLNQQSNLVGTGNVLEAARLAGVKRVVYASSAAVYGPSPSLPSREADPTGPISPYAAAKLMGEIMAATYTRTYQLETIGLRYMNVFGPRQDPTSPYSGVLSIFIQAAHGDGRCKILGDGEQTRDFVFVSDVVQANLLAAVAPYQPLAERPVFNVGRGEETSLNRLIEILNRIRSSPLQVSYGPARAGDIRHSKADISRTTSRLGYQPKTGVATGIEHTFKWMAAQE